MPSLFLEESVPDAEHFDLGRLLKIMPTNGHDYVIRDEACRSRSDRWTNASKANLFEPASTRHGVSVVATALPIEVCAVVNREGLTPSLGNVQRHQGVLRLAASDGKKFPQAHGELVTVPSERKRGAAGGAGEEDGISLQDVDGQHRATANDTRRTVNEIAARPIWRRQVNAPLKARNLADRVLEELCSVNEPGSMRRVGGYRENPAMGVYDQAWTISSSFNGCEGQHAGEWQVREFPRAAVSLKGPCCPRSLGSAVVSFLFCS